MIFFYYTSSIPTTGCAASQYSNPVYELVTMKVQENSAYATVCSVAAPNQYENIFLKCTSRNMETTSDMTMSKSYVQ